MVNLNEVFQTNKDGFSQRLNETQNLFKERYHTNIIGRDFENVLTESGLFTSYVDELVSGFEPAMASQLTEMLENTRQEILNESSLAGIQPFHSLSMPMLVKLWARLSMTNAIPTEPTKTPAFTIPFAKPYMIDAEGNKTYLPESINGPVPVEGLGLVKIPANIEMVEGRLDAHDLFEGLEAVDKELDDLDRKFSVESVFYGDVEVKLVGNQRLVLDSNNGLYAKVHYEGAEGAEEDTLIGHVDLANHTIDLVSVSGKATKIKVLGYVSSEQHTTSTQVSVEIERKDVTIGTAQHIEGSLPVEMLQDMNAMYNIDGASMITDQMTATSAQKVDLDIIEFLEKAYQGTGAAYTKEFNVVPSAQFAINPSEWLQGLRKTIDFVTTSMRNDFKIYDAYFVIVGNPLDTDLLPNVDWTFRQADDQVAGIDVTYSMGAVRGSNNYKIISSDLIDQGELTVFAVPTRDNYKTFVYYPYSFNVVSNYLNTRNERIPSIMMTRRYALEEFTPVIGKVTIKGNTGEIYTH